MSAACGLTADMFTLGLSLLVCWKFPDVRNLERSGEVLVGIGVGESLSNMVEKSGNSEFLSFSVCMKSLNAFSFVSGEKLKGSVSIAGSCSGKNGAGVVPTGSDCLITSFSNSLIL